MPRVASWRWAVILLLALFAPVRSPAQQPLRPAIDQCKARLDAQVDVGYARIAAACPRLIRLLDSSEWRPWLPPGWRDAGNDLSIGGLEELATLIERERSRELAGRRPGTGALRDVLAGLETTHDARGGFWSRFRHWLESAFRPSPDAGSSDWLDRMPRYAPLSTLAVETLSFVALSIVVALAALIVVNELRLAAALRRRAPARRRTGAPLATEEPLVWRDVQNATPPERPALLLRVIAERLTRSNRLPPAASLTVREIQARAHLPGPDDLERLAVLAAAAEQARFGGTDLAGIALDRAVHAGKELLARLDTTEPRAT